MHVFSSAQNLQSIRQQRLLCEIAVRPKYIRFVTVARRRGNQLVYGVIILLFGPPGCGKGTQAAFLVERLQIPSISTGEMFRAECKSGSRLGRRVRAILARGGLIGDEIVNAMVAGRIAQDDCRDGFPARRLSRGRWTRPSSSPGCWSSARFPTPLVIHLDVPDELLVTRLCARRQCPAVPAHLQSCSRSLRPRRASATATARR